MKTGAQAARLPVKRVSANKRFDKFQIDCDANAFSHRKPTLNASEPLALQSKEFMMEKITVYEKPTCSTCRNLNKLFEENGVDYTKVNYFIEPLTEKKLRELLRKANLSPFDVLRSKESLAKELDISKETAPDEIIKLIIENPNLLQRPIVEVGDKAVLARPIERALELINE